MVSDDGGLGIRVLKHRNTERYVVFLRSYLEDWIIKACRESKIDLRKYGLPNDPVGLHRVVNVNLVKFKRTLRESLKRSNRRVLKLKILSTTLLGRKEKSEEKKGSPGP